MSVIRRYGHGLKISGQELQTDDAALNGTALANTILRTFDFSGSAFNYTTSDPAWSDADMVDTDGAACSGLLGDNSNVPYFYAYDKAEFASVARTGSAALRLTYGGGIIADTWSGNDTAPKLVMVLPPMNDITIDLTLAGNGNSLSSAQYHRMKAGLYRVLEAGGTPTEEATVYWETQSSSATNEQIKLSSNAYTATAINGFVSGGTTQRRYRWIRRGNGVAVYGENSLGSGVFTRIQGRSHPKRYLEPRAEVFVVSLYTGNSFGASGYYVDLASMTLSGNRVIF